MSKRDRTRNRIDPHKHEAPADRTRRHQQAAGRAINQPISYEQHDAIHREAEAATLFNPNWRSNRRRVTTFDDYDVDNIAHPGHPGNPDLGDK